MKTRLKWEICGVERCGGYSLNELKNLKGWKFYEIKILERFSFARRWLVLLKNGAEPRISLLNAIKFQSVRGIELREVKIEKTPWIIQLNKCEEQRNYE